MPPSICTKDLPGHAQADETSELTKRLAEDPDSLEALLEDYAYFKDKAQSIEMISGVIHNLGNVLNSLNISILMLESRLGNSKVDGLEKLASMLMLMAPESKFLSEHPKGKHIPAYLEKLSAVLRENIEKSHHEVVDLQHYVGHMKELIRVQQNFAKNNNQSVFEPIELESVVHEAMLLHQHSFTRHNIDLSTHFESGITVTTDRHKLIQVIVNFISNAKQACSENPTGSRRVWVRTWNNNHGFAAVEVEDSGVGMAPETFRKLFVHGFTTKKTGHGFGLHSCRRIAEDLCGYVEAHSDGIGKGARFCIFLPLE